MFVYVEVDRTAVPHSCCKKNQYGKYINLKKCQVWILGPPYRQSGQLNEAVFYKVFLFSYNVILQCSLLVPRLYVCIANILTFTLYLQPSSIRGLATSWIIFLHCLLSLMDLSKRSPVSPVHFVIRGGGRVQKLVVPIPLPSPPLPLEVGPLPLEVGPFTPLPSPPFPSP